MSSETVSQRIENDNSHYGVAIIVAGLAISAVVGYSIWQSLHETSTDDSNQNQKYGPEIGITSNSEAFYQDLQSGVVQL